MQTFLGSVQFTQPADAVEGRAKRIVMFLCLCYIFKCNVRLS
jgi:hypothetical protein